MANIVDRFVERVQKAPMVSGPIAFVGAASFTGLFTGGMETLLIASSAISPIGNAAAGAVAGVNLFRERSVLSKIFSAAALGTVIIGGIAFASQMDKPDFGPLAGFFFTNISMTVASLFNLASHYTREKKITIQVESNNKPDGGAAPSATPPVRQP